MKKIVILTAILNILSCKAQEQIFDSFDNNINYGEVNGAYYKDVTGFLDQYVGTWLYTNGNTSLKVVFQKRTHLLTDLTDIKNIYYYEDILVGEYQYIENGVEKVNTLANINTNYGSKIKDVYNHYLFGNVCLRRSTSRPKCIECAPNEKRLEMYLNEPNYDGMGLAANSFVLRRYIDNGVEKLKVWFINDNFISIKDNNGNITKPADFKLPYGEYILIKQ